MRKVHLTLKIKRLTKQIDYEVGLNFGYSPNDARFDALVEERGKLLDRLRVVSPEEWKHIADSI